MSRYSIRFAEAYTHSVPVVILYLPIAIIMISILTHYPHATSTIRIAVRGIAITAAAMVAVPIKIKAWLAG